MECRTDKADTICGAMVLVNDLLFMQEKCGGRATRAMDAGGLKGRGDIVARRKKEGRPQKARESVRRERGDGRRVVVSWLS